MPPRLWIRIAELTFAFLLALAVFSSWRADCRDPKILKPLYDFTIDCKACQAKLSAAQGNLTDERKKTTALTRERDDALRIARGGSILRRIRRAAKSFLVVAAAKAAH
jgi:hypothetical protein